MPFHCVFTIMSDTKYLAILREWISAAQLIVGRRAFPKRAKIACTLALIEAVDNAIFHAHKKRASLPIGVSLKIGDKKVTIEVDDGGGGIGRHEVSHPDEMTDHGRGLFLIHKLMTKVESRMKGRRHLLRMTYKT